MTRHRSADEAHQNLLRARLAQLVCRLGRAAGGHAGIEYALVLAVVICAAVSAALLLGMVQRRSLGQVAQDVKQTDVERKRSGATEPRNVEIEVSSNREWLLPISLILGSLSLWSIGRLLAHRPKANAGLSNAFIGNEVKQARYVGARQQILRAVRNNLQNLQVRHVMTDHVATASPTASLGELAQLMSDLEVWQVIFFSASGEPLGIVSHRFLKGAPGKQARHIMSEKPLTIAPDMDLRVAITLMLDRNLSCIPVVDAGKLQGMLTTTELAMGFQVSTQLLQQLPADVLATL